MYLKENTKQYEKKKMKEKLFIYLCEMNWLIKN